MNRCGGLYQNARSSQTRVVSSDCDAVVVVCCFTSQLSFLFGATLFLWILGEAWVVLTRYPLCASMAVAKPELVYCLIHCHCFIQVHVLTAPTLGFKPTSVQQYKCVH